MPRVVVKNFWSHDYGECNIQIPLIKDMENLFLHKVLFEHIDADKCPKDVKKYRVKDFPTIIIECDGKERERFIGLTQQRFLRRAIERTLSECR